MKKMFKILMISLAVWCLIFGFDLKFGYDDNEGTLFFNFKTKINYKIK